MNDYYIFVIYLFAFITVLLIAEISYKYYHVSVEITRKIAHIGSGIVALTYPYFADNHWIIFILAIFFTILLQFSKHKGYFPSIFDIERKSIGELLFVWNVWLLFLLYIIFDNEIYFYLPFSIVVFSDSFAAIVGKIMPIKKYRLLGSQKSWGGSFVFFILTMFFTFLFIPASNYDDTYFYLFVFVFSVITTFVEAISFSGFDNMSVPVVAIILLYFYFG